MIKVIDVQPTPNPDALKFIVSARITDKGAKSFEDHRAGAGDPLAKSLFELGPVAGVFMLDRFVTVTKFHAADWPGLKDKVVEAIEAGAEPVHAPAAPPPPAPEDDVMVKINQVIDQHIRPALAADGGGMEIVSFQDNLLSVRYQGACGGCPSSTSGTLFAIQNLLQRMVDEKIKVEPVQ